MRVSKVSEKSKEEKKSVGKYPVVVDEERPGTSKDTSLDLLQSTNISKLSRKRRSKTPRKFRHYESSDDAESTHSKMTKTVHSRVENSLRKKIMCLVKFVT